MTQLNKEMDLFEQIKIMSMTEDEKLELLELGPDYLKVLINDDSMAIRLRAKVRLSKWKSTVNETEAQRQKDIEQLHELVKSEDFGVRLKAKILLNRLTDNA